ncbi:hypothetical protein [Paraburkholderia phosphatilytica]|uniref:hypothetical protein n=1 Tax=Paraburkholderia phosphatilytica TaxID=2282883 RepID=UPI000F5FA7A0|nr:hypothetical protein [Paraburkholderia phosphatilytica]
MTSKREIQTRITEMLAAGEKKQAVFAALSGNGVSDKVVARLIASHVDPQRCAKNKVHRWIVVALAYFQLLIVALVALLAIIKLPLIAGLLIAGFALAVAGVFVWGLTTNKAQVYNAFIMLSVIHLPRQLQGLDKDPLFAALGMAFAVAVVAYVWFVRRRLFPDFTFISVGKVNGQYVFVD